MGRDLKSGKIKLVFSSIEVNLSIHRLAGLGYSSGQMVDTTSAIL